MEPNEQLPPQNQSTRPFEEWRASLLVIIMEKKGVPADKIIINDEKVRPYYDQCLMPDVCFKELFNR